MKPRKSTLPSKKVRKALTEELTVSVKVASEALGIGQSLTYAGIKDKKIPSIRIGRRVAIPTAAIRKMLHLEA